MKTHVFIGTLLLCAAVAGCGGGGSSPTPRPTPTPTQPVNHPPKFTSSADASVAEGVTDAYQATADDPDSNQLRYLISGGDDAGQFAISDAGSVQFLTPPNFEQPTDADGDNIYLIQLEVSDGEATATLDVRLTVTNDREGINVRRVATGFDHPVAVLPNIDDPGKVFVAERGGDIYSLSLSTGTKKKFLTVPAFHDQFYSYNGPLQQVELRPASTKEGKRDYDIYILRTDEKGDLGLGRFWSSGFGHPERLFSVSNELNAPAQTGWFELGSNGDYYLATSDAHEPDSAQNTYSRHGKILHFVRNPNIHTSASVQYFIPAPGNPFINGGGDQYVSAYGLHSPSGSTIYKGKLFFGDRGMNLAEEIDRFDTSSSTARNFGWPFAKGARHAALARSRLVSSIHSWNMLMAAMPARARPSSEAWFIRVRSNPWPALTFSAMP